MKLVSSILAASFLTFSNFAQADLIAKGCYLEKDQKIGWYTVIVEIHSNAVSVNYRSKDGQNLGQENGTIFSSQIKKDGNKVTVKDVTLNSRDGWIDGAKIEITDKTVTFDSKDETKGPRPKVKCPSM